MSWDSLPWLTKGDLVGLVVAVVGLLLCGVVYLWLRWKDRRGRRS